MRVADPDPGQVRRLDHAGPGDVRDVEDVGFTPAGERGGNRGERLGRGVVDAGGGDRDQRPFGILKRGQTATEHAARVHAQGVVQPLRGRHRGVAVHHDGAAPVLGRPRVTDRQAVLVGLAGGLPVQAELADPARGAAVVALDQAGVRHHQAAPVQHVVADQAVDEPLHADPELLGLGVQLLHRGVQAVAALDVLAAQRLEQLGLVVAGHAERGPGRDHAHDQAQHARRVRAPVDQVADEYGAPAAGVAGADGAAGRVAVDLVAERRQQLLEFGPAAVHVADDVERACLVPQVAVQPGPADGGGGDLLGGVQHVHGAEPFAAKPAQPAAELAALAAEHVRAEVPVRPAGVPLRTELFRQVEHDRGRQHVVLAGQHDQLAAGFGLHVGGVDDGQAAGLEALAGDELQHLERGRRGGLVVLVVGDQAAAEVRGDHLGRPEVRPGERRLARAGHADQ